MARRRDSKVVIPTTKLYRRYDFLSCTSLGERRAQAEWFAGTPGELAKQFEQSVNHFAPYDNRSTLFFEGEHDELPITPLPITTTPQLAARLRHQGSLVPREPAGGRTRPDAPKGLGRVPASALRFEYVEREVTLTRTLGARWEHGPDGSSKFTLDFLLRACDGDVPVATEAKIGGDKDAYYALIQALASAACMATEPQYDRLCNHWKGIFAEPANPPRVDVLLLFVTSPTAGTEHPRINLATECIAASLLASPTVARSIRRMVGLDVANTESLDAEVRFAYEAPLPSP